MKEVQYPRKYNKVSIYLFANKKNIKLGQKSKIICDAAYPANWNI